MYIGARLDYNYYKFWHIFVHIIIIKANKTNKSTRKKTQLVEKHKHWATMPSEKVREKPQLLDNIIKVGISIIVEIEVETVQADFRKIRKVD